MNNRMRQIERKFRKFAVHDLIKYVLILYVLATILDMMMPGDIYGTYLALDFTKVLKGEVWRLVTFILRPYSIGGGFSILCFAIEIYLYQMIGKALEDAWGDFWFNMYFYCGILFNIIAGFILFIGFEIPYTAGLEFIFRSMFFAFAALYPNMELLLYFVIPIKVKWIAYLYGILLGYEVITSFKAGYYALGTSILVALGNFLLLFLLTRDYRRVSPKEIRRRKNFKKQVARPQGVTRHKCAICGRTEEDNPELEFRFCSKCEGNYEYCSDHLFTHEHVHKV